MSNVFRASPASLRPPHHPPILASTPSPLSPPTAPPLNVELTPSGMLCIYWRSKHPSPQKRLGTGGYPSYTSVACFLLRRYSRYMCTPMPVCAHAPPSLFWRGVLRMAVDRSWAQSNYDSKAHSWNQNRINGPNQGYINLPSWPEREPCLEESLVWDIC